MKCQNNQKLSEVLWVMTTSSWIIELFCFYLFFPPDLLPDPVQAVFTIQTRTSAPSTTTWSLQRAAAWRRNPPRSQTRRCSSCSRILSGLCAWTVICLHDGVSVMCLYPSTCALSPPWIPREFSFLFVGCAVFCVGSCRPHGVLFLCRSPECIQPAGGSYDTAIMHKERWEINDSARWRQSSFFSLDRAVTCGECHSANIHLRSTPLHSAAAPLCNTARTDALCEIVF